MRKKVKVILGSVRTGRAGKVVADWFMREAEKYDGNLDIEFIDLADVDLPFMDEPIPPGMSGGNYVNDHTKEWSRVINEADGFVFVTPEYNHGYSPALKNAIDYLKDEWNEKPVAFVGYGLGGATHSINQLKQVVEFLGMRVLDERIGISEVWAALDESGGVKAEKLTGDVGTLLTVLEDALTEASVAGS